MERHLTVAILAVLLGAQTPATKVSYFPPDTLDETAVSSRSREQWYSEHLRALKESSLWDSSKNQKLQSYRFLWLRTFDHPISVRLDVQQDGTSLLTRKITNGQGGYKPGKLVVNKSRKLTKDETAWFLERVEEVGFWKLASFEKAYEIGPNGEKLELIGVDGAEWIVEGVKDGKYHVVDRWSPEKGPVRILGIVMLVDLAKLKLLFTEVY
jgi:hypothetical protein